MGLTAADGPGIAAAPGAESKVPRVVFGNFRTPEPHLQFALF